jgi:phage terminase small subunit
MGELSAKQRQFALEYLKDLNATQAAVRAGYSAKTAYAQGSRLLSKAEVQAFIAARQSKRAEKLEISAQRVLEEMARVAFADIGAAFDENGGLLPIHRMPEDTRRALASVESDELSDGAGSERASIGTTRKVKMFDKLRSLEMLGKHLGLFEEGANRAKADTTGEVVIRRRAPDGSLLEVSVGGTANSDRPVGHGADEDAVRVPDGPDASAGDDRRGGLGEVPDPDGSGG